MRSLWTIGFTFSGFFLIVQSLLKTGFLAGINGPWIFLLSGGIVMIGLLIDLRFAAAGLLLNLVLRYVMGDTGLVWDATAYAAGLGLFYLGAAYRCPRCELSLHKNTWSRWTTATIPDHCTVCGRTRKDVRPFQYRSRPEPWDGHYHDEGGGPFPTDLDVADMALYYAQERYKKRRRRR